ncbi:NAD(+)/NADH kinase [Candidatus Woesearchaeota archaeon]|nr:NAD(+)/NADH kinase [Candidatus Woesearchaeota archaeon]
MRSAAIIYHEGQFKELLVDVHNYLRKKGIEVLFHGREHVCAGQCSGKDIVIVIGGDGTFLRTSHHNRDTRMFGINPDPKKKEGFYMQADINDYKDKLDRIIKGKFKTIDLLRLSIEINGEKTYESALNDVYIGDMKPYNMFNYDISVENKKEFQRSSGIIIGTPSGSNAWLKSAGGIVMGLEEKKIQYIVREPYERKLTKGYTLIKGITEDKIEITFRSPGIVVVDSIGAEHKVAREGKVIVKAADSPLRYILLD